VESKEFEQVKNVDSDEYEGRTSGSLEWRIARGETRGGNPVRKSRMMELAPIELTDLEIKNGYFHLEYSSNSDE